MTARPVSVIIRRARLTLFRVRSPSGSSITPPDFSFGCIRFQDLPAALPRFCPFSEVSPASNLNSASLRPLDPFLRSSPLSRSRHGSHLSDSPSLIPAPDCERFYDLRSPLFGIPYQRLSKHGWRPPFLNSPLPPFLNTPTRLQNEITSSVSSPPRNY